jgi:hypothetical protein
MSWFLEKWRANSQDKDLKMRMEINTSKSRITITDTISPRILGPRLDHVVAFGNTYKMEHDLTRQEFQNEDGSQRF